jgi:hypothetical protein
MMKWAPANWNDILAPFMLLGLPLLWVFASLPEIVLGATIAGWTLVVQYFWRKAPPGMETEPNPDTLPPRG